MDKNMKQLTEKDFGIPKKAARKAMETVKATTAKGVYHTPVTKTAIPIKGKVGLNYKEAISRAKDVIARNAQLGAAKFNALSKTGKAGVIGGGLAATTAGIYALARRKRARQEALELKEQQNEKVKTRKESIELNESKLGGKNMFKNTLENVITERFVTGKIGPTKYLKLMEKIDHMTEGKALDILQEISLAGMKEKAVKGATAVKGAAVKGATTVKEKAIALVDYVVKKTGASKAAVANFVKKYYTKFGTLPTAGKVIAGLGLAGAAVAGGIAAKKKLEKK